MEDASPTIAVIIPSYNYERYVGRAIESVTSQGFEGCELVVVDDGSTDKSWDVILSHRLPKAIRVPNGGAAKACLAALGLTTAPHVLVLDSDDELAPGSLARIASMLDPQVAKLQFAVTRIDGSGRVTGGPCPPLGTYRMRARLVAEVEATGCYVTPPTSGNVFRRDVLELMRETDDTFVDGLALIAAPYMGDVVSTGEALGSYRVHGNGLSGLGARPTPDRLRRDVRLFEARLGHLDRILRDRGVAHSLPRPRDTLFHRERSLYAKVAEGSRPTPGEVAGLLRALARHPMPLARKAAFAAMAVAPLMLTARRARDLLEYRLTPDGRSVTGLVRRVLLGAPPPRGTQAAPHGTSA